MIYGFFQTDEGNSWSLLDQSIYLNSVFLYYSRLENALQSFFRMLKVFLISENMRQIFILTLGAAYCIKLSREIVENSKKRTITRMKGIILFQ